MKLRFLVLCALATAGTLHGAPARADESAANRATARDLAQQAQQALDKKDYATAADLFARAADLVHAPTISLALAHAQVGLGKLVEAHETYSKIIHDGLPKDASKLFAKAFADAQKEIEEVAARLAWITLDVKGAPSPKATIDGGAIPQASLGIRRAINPGAHEVAATADGYKSASKSLRVREGQSTSLTLTLEVDPNAVVATPATAPAQGSGQTSDIPGAYRDRSGGSATAGIVVMSIGGAALIAGGITGVMAMQKHTQLVRNCPNGVCPASEHPTEDSYKTLGLVSTISFAVGGAALGTGLVLLLTRSKGSEHGFVAPYLGVASAGVTGEF